MLITNVQLTLKWHDSTSRFNSGEDLYIGKVKVANIHFDGVSRNPDKHKAVTYMSGVKENLGNFATIELAKERAEIAAKYWIENCLTKPKE